MFSALPVALEMTSTTNNPKEHFYVTGNSVDRTVTDSEQELDIRVSTSKFIS